MNGGELRRVAFSVPDGLREETFARLLQLHPEGFEETDGELVVYTDAAGEERLRRQFADVSVVPVEPGWEDRWQEFHRPVWVGPLWIGPPWEESPADAIAVVIDPGRAFGTGSHPTTRLCVAFLLDVDPGSLVDLGCGSGVLSVAAAKLGFDPVVALDREPAAVEATRRNARANAARIDVRLADVLADELPRAETAVANIELAAIEALAPRLEAETLVTAGYFRSRTPDLPGFVHRVRRLDGGWAADLFERE